MTRIGPVEPSNCWRWTAIAWRRTAESSWVYCRIPRRCPGKPADPEAIRENLDRITRAIEDDDPAQAIGSAQDLIESTAKIVLSEVVEPVDPKDDLPQRVLKAQKALQMHPSSVAPGPDSSEAEEDPRWGDHHYRWHR
jgi:hypothetical protein